MTAWEKTAELREAIAVVLSRLVTDDYWLAEVPHYSNVGDTLIWQGEMDFLRTLSFRCKGMCSFDSLSLPMIGNSGLVLFQGGGNFGDLWKEPHEYRKRIMAANPKCRFLVFPQTIWYEDEANLRADADFFARFDCTICARDRTTLAFLEHNFKNETVLVPDMAFCIDMRRWNGKFSASRPLLLMRGDKEIRMTPELARLHAEAGADIRDWPPMEERRTMDSVRDAILRRPRKLGWLYEPYMYHVYRPYLIRSGVRLIGSHTDIYTTRLHGCILGVLMDKERIVFFDNSYGKNRGFYDTWLRDCDAVEMVRQHG